MVLPKASVSSVRRAIGTYLRQLRRQSGWTILEVAIATGINQTRLTRIEQGRVVPRDDEFDLLLERYQAPQTIRESLRVLIEDEKQEIRNELPPPQSVCGPSLYELQKNAWSPFANVTHVRWLEVSLIPGVLQTRPYMETIFSNCILSDPQRVDVKKDVELSIRERLEAQRILYDRRRTFEFLIPESMLSISLAYPDQMSAQCLHLIQTSFLSNVSIGIIPAGVKLPVFTLHPFIVLDDNLVHAEHTFGDVQIKGRYQIDVCIQTFGLLSELSLHGDEARKVLMRMVDWHLSFES